MDSEGFNFGALRSAAGPATPLNTSTSRRIMPDPNRPKPNNSVFSFMTQQNQNSQSQSQHNQNAATTKKPGGSRTFTVVNQSRVSEDNYRQQGSPAFKPHAFSRSQQFRYVDQNDAPLPSGLPAQAHSHSRSPSVESRVDLDDMDLSELMSRKMKETTLIKAQLAEERVAGVNLKSQLSAAQKTIDGLKARLHALESSSNENISHLQASEEHLQQTQTNLADVQATLAEVQAELASVHAEGDRARGAHAHEIQKFDDEIQRVKFENEQSSRKFAETEARLDKVKRLAKRGLEDFTARYDALKKDLDQLRVQYEASEAEVQHTRREIEMLKNSTEDQMKVIDPILHHSGRYFAKGIETRDLIEELQNDKASAHQVVDLLRDKLHNSSSQLAEARVRIAELEENERDGREMAGKNAGVLQKLGEEMKIMTEKMQAREKEELELLADAAQMEGRLKEAAQRILDLEAAVKENSNKANSAQDDNHSLRIVTEKQALTIDHLQESQRSLAIVESKASEQDKEIAGLKESVRMLESSKVELVASLWFRRAKQATEKISQLEENLRQAQSARVAELTKKEQALEKVGVLQKQVDTSKKDLVDNEQEFTQLNKQIAVLQERFDSQTMTLRLTKEHCGDIQDHLLQSEKSFATKLEAGSSKFALDVALLQEQNTSLQNQNSALQDSKATIQDQLSSLQARLDLDRKTHQEALAASTADFLQHQEKTLASHQESLSTSTAALEKTYSAQKDSLVASIAALEKRLEQQDKKNQKLVEAQNNRASFAENQAKESVGALKVLQGRCENLEKEREDLRKVVENVQKELEEARRGLEEAKQKHGEAEMRDEMGDQVLELKGELERKNGEIRLLQEKEASLQQRYKDGQLRDNMITTLQTKIQKLESTLAKCLREKGKVAGTEGKSMVDLSLFMSSSPNNGLPLPAAPTQIPVKLQTPTSPRIKAHSPAGPPRMATNFAKLDADDDDDDDISESDDDVDNSYVGPSKISLGKRERMSSPVRMEDARPARRSKAVAARKIEADLDKKLMRLSECWRFCIWIQGETSSASMSEKRGQPDERDTKSPR
ncbi:hypothetical protein C8J56DRAFT_893199 [Mycena floridula]|nr:hypothetical protein C8J56DRAFT_893199 [Mycena floridula]